MRKFGTWEARTQSRIATPARAVLYVLGGGLLGAVLGHALMGAVVVGYGTPWERVTSLPGDPERLVVDDYHIAVILTDGRVFDCEMGTCTELHLTGRRPMLGVYQPCPVDGPAFRWYNNAPRNVKDCVFLDASGDSGIQLYAQALDRRGDLWRWRHVTGCDMVDAWFALTVLAGFGLIAGAFFGGVALRRRGSPNLA